MPSPFDSPLSGISSPFGVLSGLGGGFNPVPSFGGLSVFSTIFEGADGASSDLTDRTGNHTMTFAGGAELSTSQSVLLPSSLIVDGVTGSYVSVADSDDFDLGGADFTISFLVRFTAWPASNANASLLYKSTDGTGHAYVNTFFSSRRASFRQKESDTSVSAIQSNIPSPTLDTWYNIMFCGDHSGGFIRVYVGVYGSGTDGGSYIGKVAWDGTSETNALSLLLGGRTTGEALNGYMNEVYINKGAAYLKSEGTYTVPEEPMDTL